MATYTFTQKVLPAGPEDFFAAQYLDGAHNPVTFGSGMQTVDISGSPIVSPATVSNSAVTTITVPLNASAINIITATNTINLSEADSTVATKYATIPVNTLVSIGVTRQSVLYLKANTGAATVSFWFTII